MDNFKLSKYQTIHDNIPYMAQIAYKLIDSEISIDELLQKYEVHTDLKLSINLEKIIYLALMFLYAIGKIQITNGLIKKV